MIVLAESKNDPLHVAICYSVPRFLLGLSYKGSEYPLSCELSFDLPGSILSLTSSAFNAFREVTGLNAILASFHINLQNSAKEGISSLGLFPIHSRCMTVFLQFIKCYPFINNSAQSYYHVTLKFLNNLLVLVWISKDIQIVDDLHFMYCNVPRGQRIFLSTP